MISPNKENSNIKEKMFCCFFLSRNLWDCLYIKYKLGIYGSIKNKTVLIVLSDINIYHKTTLMLFVLLKNAHIQIFLLKCLVHFSQEAQMQILTYL